MVHSVSWRSLVVLVGSCSLFVVLSGFLMALIDYLYFFAVLSGSWLFSLVLGGLGLF